VAGSRDDVVEDDVFGEQVEEVPTIGNAIEALLDDAKERVERLEVVEVGDRRRHDGLTFMSTPARSAARSGCTHQSTHQSARTPGTARAESAC